MVSKTQQIFPHNDTQSQVIPWVVFLVVQVVLDLGPQFGLELQLLNNAAVNAHDLII